MHRLRTTWMQRGLVLLLASSLLPLAMVWPQSSPHAASDSHADWLRSQVRVPLDGDDEAAFEAALQSAAGAAPQALHAFLRHFVDAYAQQDSGLSLAAVLGLTHGAEQHIVNELQRRLARASSWALAPRSSLSMQSIVDGAASPRHASSGALLAGGPALLVRLVESTVQSVEPAARGVVWTVSSARPRAP